MSDQSRSLPDRPSLRYLKLEARRRQAAGEFPTLHEAQLAIAREHGQSSWTVLKELIGNRQPDPEGAALEHVRWVTSRFAGAGQPDWSAPEVEELGEHFEEPFLDRGEPLSTAHRFPVYAITTLITATAVLRLVADGRVDLDGAVRDLLTLNDRYAALGTLIEDVTGQPYRDAAADLVLGPLGMSSSWFPAQRPGAGPRAVTGYELDQEGSFRPAPESADIVPAAAGLWATAADLVCFGLGWSSLLPAELAREALRPQVRPYGDALPAVGLGWRIKEASGVAGHAGRARGGSASLVLRLDSGQVFVAMASRGIPIEPVNGRVVRAIAGDPDPDA